MDETQIKEKIIILIKSFLNNDRSTIDKIYNDLNKNADIQISIVENYGSHFKLNVSCQNFNISFELEYGDDYLPF